MNQRNEVRGGKGKERECKKQEREKQMPIVLCGLVRAEKECSQHLFREVGVSFNYLEQVWCVRKRNAAKKDIGVCGDYVGKKVCGWKLCRWCVCRSEVVC